MTSTISSTDEKNLAIAETYYNAMSKKDFVNLEKCMHPNIQFSSPLALLIGKDNVAPAAKAFAYVIKQLTIREKFAIENKVMLVYDLDSIALEKSLKVAALFTFEDDLISKLELFFDPRPFVSKS